MISGDDQPKTRTLVRINHNLFFKLSKRYLPPL